MQCLRLILVALGALVFDTESVPITKLVTRVSSGPDDSGNVKMDGGDKDSAFQTLEPSSNDDDLTKIIYQSGVYMPWLREGMPHTYDVVDECMRQFQDRPLLFIGDSYMIQMFNEFVDLALHRTNNDKIEFDSAKTRHEYLSTQCENLAKLRRKGIDIPIFFMQCEMQNNQELMTCAESFLHDSFVLSDHHLESEGDAEIKTKSNEINMMKKDAKSYGYASVYELYESLVASSRKRPDCLATYFRRFDRIVMSMHAHDVMESEPFYSPFSQREQLYVDTMTKIFALLETNGIINRVLWIGPKDLRHSGYSDDRIEAMQISTRSLSSITEMCKAHGVPYIDQFRITSSCHWQNCTTSDHHSSRWLKRLMIMQTLRILDCGSKRSLDALVGWYKEQARVPFYMYDLPEYDSCVSSHQDSLLEYMQYKHGGEVFFIDQLRRSPWRVQRRDEAEFLVVPLHFGWNARSGLCQSALSSAFEKIRIEWRTSRESSPLLVLSTDYRVHLESACPECVVISLHPLSSPMKSQLESTASSAYTRMTAEEMKLIRDQDTNLFKNRSRAFYFAGQADEREAYMSRRQVRRVFQRMGFEFVTTHPGSTHSASSYTEKIATTKFGLHVRGDNPQSSRLYELIDAGTVLVMLSDEIFDDWLPGRHIPWHDMTIQIKEGMNDDDLETELRRISLLPTLEVERIRGTLREYASSLLWDASDSVVAEVLLLDARSFLSEKSEKN